MPAQFNKHTWEVIRADQGPSSKLAKVPVREKQFGRVAVITEFGSCHRQGGTLSLGTEYMSLLLMNASERARTRIHTPTIALIAFS